jgi:serine phosphatase RsbU (regulator of sigma subunit)/Tfp pilus assembly protein PilF
MQITLKHYFTFFIAITLFTRIVAQDSYVDSLVKVVPTMKDDTSKVKALIDIVWEYASNDSIKAKKYAQQAFDLAKKINYNDGIGEYYNSMGNLKYEWSLSSEGIPYYEKAILVFQKTNNLARVSKMYSNMGNSYSDIGKISKAIECHTKSIELSSKVNDKRGLAAAYVNIGSVYANSGEYQLAVESLLKALKLKEEMGDKKGIANACNNLSVVFKEQKNYKQSIVYANRALEIWQEMGDEINCAFIYNNLGLVYGRLKDYDQAKASYKKGLAIFERENVKRGIVAINDNLGLIFKFEKHYSDAIECFKKVHDLSVQTNDVKATISSHINLGDTYLLMNKFDLAYSNMTKAYELALKSNYRNDLAQVYLGFSDYYKAKNDYPKALDFRTKYEELNDSLLNEDITAQIADVEKKYDTEKKELQIKDLEQNKLINQLELEKKEQDITRQRIVIVVSVLVLILAISLAFFIYRNYKEKEKSNQQLQIAYSEIEEKNHLVEEKNKEILDSIFYAKRIQTALLASDKLLTNHLPEHFVLYKPKDIVSGDFYWAKSVNDNFLICAADCTGHGVPGAFMSLLGVSYLNEIVRDKAVNSPAEVLNKLRTEIIHSLNTELSEDEYAVNDGMDIALCNYKFNSMKLQFSCANNPLWLLRENKIIEYKADKFPVGKYHGDLQNFSNNEIDLKKGDIVYILTDGYADQFGGPSGKKFKYKPLQELLVANHQKPMQEQKQLLNEVIDAWRGNLEQVDDILIIGVRV